MSNQKEIPYDYRQKIDNVAELQIIDDKEDYILFCLQCKKLLILNDQGLNCIGTYEGKNHL